MPGSLNGDIVDLFLVVCFFLLFLKKKSTQEGCHGEVMLDYADWKGHNDTATSDDLMI
jgi:hypothetical protein